MYAFLPLGALGLPAYLGRYDDDLIFLLPCVDIRRGRTYRGIIPRPPSGPGKNNEESYCCSPASVRLHTPPPQQWIRRDRTNGVPEKGLSGTQSSIPREGYRRTRKSPLAHPTVWRPSLMHVS